ncbi:J domain-containing protein [Micromonospora sp. CPCC 206060]|uniref:J domain-containing protein n=1 Tax=Micromonospora sp. CPCC 206060 TaxID=3122406 RepID=UPI002FF43E8E
MSPSLRDLGGRDPYEILGIGPEATTEEIVAAYRRKVRLLHPDTATGDARAATLLNLARDVLCDPDTRRAYDRQVADGVDPVDVEPPTTSLWDDDEVVPGAADSPHSDWRAQDPPDPEPVVTEVYPDSPPYPPPPYPPSPYPPPPSPPPHWPPPLASRPQSSGMPLGVLALILSFVCGPVGLIMGIIALTRNPPPGSADRICAFIAVGVTGLLLCCSMSAYGSALLSSIGSQA